MVRPLAWCCLLAAGSGALPILATDARASFASPTATASPVALHETGRPLFRQFSFRDYDAHHQVWAAVEGPAGLMYFGNKGCVLEYDGASWRTIAVPETTFVRALDRATDGTIYVGAVDELGYLAPNAAGEKQFVSLKDKLPAAYQPCGDVWQVVATPDGSVFFAADRVMLRWRDGAFHAWPFPEERTPYVYPVGDRLFLHRRNEPLQLLQGDAFVPFADSPDLRVSRLRHVLPFDDGRVLAVTGNRGLFLIERDGSTHPFRTAIDRWLREDGVQCAARTRERLLIASPQNGVMLLDLDGDFIRRIDLADGLRDPQVKFLQESRDGSIWLSLNNGIAQLVPPFGQSFFAREHGLDGSTIRAITRSGGVLHAATGIGVQRLVPANPESLRNARFESTPGFAGRYFSLVAVPGGLLGGELEHLHWQPGGSREIQTLVTGPSFLAMTPSRRIPGRVWAATGPGLMSLDHTADGWRSTRPPAGLDFEARSVAEMEDGTLWLGSFTRGVARVRWTSPTAAPEVAWFRESHGLPAGHVSFHVVRAGDHLFANSGHGASFRWEPTRGEFLSLTPEASGPARLGAGAAPSGWLVSPSLTGSADAIREFTSDGRVRTWSFPELLRTTGPLQQVFAEINADGSRVLWLSGAEGIGRVDLDHAVSTPPAPGLVLRSARFDARADWNDARELPAGPHRLEFAYSASATARAAEFSTRLEGLEEAWSPWTTNRAREFSSLPAGNFVFRARTRDGVITGRNEIAFAFRIAAPWWQTWWANTIAVLLGIGAIAGLVRWRLGALRRRAAELERTIARRTAELKSSNEQLLVARDAADSANRAKSAFLAHMSHELRTPLNAVLGYAQILARDPAQSTGARDRLRVINESGQHLLALINEVLDLARVESGKMSLHLAPCALPEALQQVAAVMRGPCEAAGLAFEFRADPALPALVHTDEQKLRQVLLNLLGNAVKFTPGGHVKLEVVRGADDRVRFCVTDTGPGIAPERQQEIFQPFATSMKDGAQGTGLGLALSQRIVEFLGGSLRVDSVPGQGASFSFELRLPKLTEGATPGASLRSGRTRTGYAGARRRLLVVDDEATNRTVLRELLAPLDFEIDEAHDAESALAVAEARRPDAVLLDLRFRSGADGFAIARRLRAGAAGATAKIIAVSASVFASDRHEAIQAGCDDFLPKPFQEEQLHAVLGAALQLTWIESAVSPVPAGPTAGANGARVDGAPLDSVLRDELLDLARRGDARRLQVRLGEIAAAPNAPARLGELQELAAGFQMKRLRDLLAADEPTAPSQPSATPVNEPLSSVPRTISPDAQDHPDRR